MKKVGFTLILLALLLTACEVTPTVDLTPPTATTQPTATLTPSPTPTPTAPSTPTAIPTPPPLAVPAEVTAWLTANAVPFDSPLPGRGCDDLRPLLDMVGDARIVALGEATHGTSEFFTMKHRILECLVQEKGFNILALEATDPDLVYLNAYLQTGEGDMETALGRLLNFWTLNTDEFFDMLAWLHTHNQNPGQTLKVSLRGFDVTSGHMALQILLDYMEWVDPHNLEQVQEDVDCLRRGMTNPQNYAAWTTENQLRCQQSIEDVHALLLNQRSAYQTASSPLAYAEAVEAARILQQYEELLRTDYQDSTATFNLRDRFMAENVAWLLEQAGPEAKIVLWAHNGHVQTSTLSRPNLEDIASLPPETAPTLLPMGVHLREWFGDELVVIGFSFQSGSFNAMGMDLTNGFTGRMEHTARAPLPDSHEAYLYPEGLARYYLDLRTIPLEGEIADWFQEPRWFRFIGNEYLEDYGEYMVQSLKLPNAFDVIVCLRDTTPSRGR